MSFRLFVSIFLPIYVFCAHPLDSGLSQAFSQRNHWNFKCVESPQLVSDGLTYWLESEVKIEESCTGKLEDLYIEIYKYLLNMLNKQKRIRPFLADFPLSTEQFSMKLIVHSKINGKKLRSTAALHHGILDLHIETVFGTESKQIPLLDIEKKLEGEKTVRTRSGVRYQIPEISTRTSPDLRRLLEGFCRKHALKIAVIGCADKEAHSSKAYQFVLYGHQRLDLQAARTLAKKCTEELLDLVKKKESFEVWKKMRDEQRLVGAAFRITFWNEEMDRPLAPQIAAIHVFGDSFHYFTADECQHLVPIYTESFQEKHKR